MVKGIFHIFLTIVFIFSPFKSAIPILTRPDENFKNPRKCANHLYTRSGDGKHPKKTMKIFHQGW